MAERDLSDYIEVATRIADFREKYPEGTLAPWNPAEPWKLIQAEGFDKDGSVLTQTFLVYVAAAYRDRDDPHPGVGTAWEIFPGRTPYTRGSELQNAETSAWGRAIIAVGASDSKAGIASREEVAARRAERDDGEGICPCGHGKHKHIEGGCLDCHCKLLWNRDGRLSRSWRAEPERGYETCAVRNAFGVACGLPKGHDQQPGASGLHGWEAGALPRNADGSLSRSRTSDEEKAAAGVMTDAEQRAHNKLRRDGEPAAGRVEKTSGSGSDEWQVDPGHWAAGALPPEDQPGSSTPQQRQHLAMKLAEIGLASPEQGRAWCSEQLGREIATRKDLSLVEGRRLLDVVDKVIDANRKAAKT